ncbi:ATP-binding protein [Haloarcula halophila]|uniref:ATP-binding protein n=1 Tax=Haloarcula TaxID=2237 RepID=UPI0023E366F6|nr:ATP-binding protein [Halomicroarcula sp. DFY41]
MSSGSFRSSSPALIAGVGVLLLVAAITHHITELFVLDTAVGPIAALVLDVPAAVGLTYAGYWLSRTTLDQRERWTVCVWCFAGVILFVAVIGATLGIQFIEGRTVSEPGFSLLIAAEAGGVAGFLGGYYNARARASARRATTARNALGFVNELIRHDLRNDLNVIHGHADLLADADRNTNEPGDPAIVREKSMEALTRIETSRAIASTLLHDPELDPVDVVPIVREITTQFDDAFQATVTVDLPESAVVSANAGIRSVLDNLVENAIEHNDSAEPRVEVTVHNEPETVTITVADNGPGIDSVGQEQLLNADAATGGGGLSLAATLVENFGGELDVTESPLGGTAVEVTLPTAE